VCSYCGGPFGLTRHYVGLRHHLCSEKCKQQFLEARARDFAEYRQWCGRVSRAGRN
jgi:hypothetical protein